MEDFGESENMIKISGKVDKSNTYNGFSSNISFFIQGRKERNTTIKVVVCIWLIHFSAYFYHIYIYIYIYKWCIHHFFCAGI